MSQSIVIIGAGASGLASAIFAARKGAAVTVLEANDKPGRKLLATGNGKCNLTNLNMDSTHYHSDDPEFVQTILDTFPADAAMAFFTSLGLLQKNRDGWVYPITEQSLSVLNVLLYEAEHLGVRIKTRERVIRVEKTGQAGDPQFRVYTATWQYECSRIIVACGSPASAVRGSSDDVMSFAEEAGVSIRPFRPSLVPLRVRGDFCGKWAGVRVTGEVSLIVGGKIRARSTGILQLTDYGISGIPTLQISHEAVRALDEGERNVLARLDFFPDESYEELLCRLQMREDLCSYKSLKQQLTGLIPEQLIPIICGKKDTDAAIAKKLKRFELVVTGPAPLRHAQVCQGGVRTAELTRNMESKKCPGLYFTGEAVDVDGECGGYNLQWAWASGYAAGTAISDSELK
jgi:predicted Rossmann fold flavoprotein